jgi:hypothetical protein
MTDDLPTEGFARRWSRLKRQPVRAEPAPQIQSMPPAEETPVEIPPPADSIPIEDITAWLGKRLPDGWREAALRRLWSSDIAIRDFVGPADYAWDWNTPGMAPGWGPLRTADDIVRLLARAIGEDTPPEPPEADADAPVSFIGPEMEIAVAETLPEPEGASPPAVTTEYRPEPVALQPPRRGGRATPV